MLHSLHPVFDLMFSFNRSIFLLQFCNHFNPSQIENKCAQRIIFQSIYQQLIFFRDQTIFPALWIHNILSKQIILRDHSALGGQLWSQSLLCCARCESQNRPAELPRSEVCLVAAWQENCDGAHPKYFSSIYRVYKIPFLVHRNQGYSCCKLLHLIEINIVWDTIE